jgi:transcriptional regulator of aromatic amino acid metabolism
MTSSNGCAFCGKDREAAPMVFRGVHHQGICAECLDVCEDFFQVSRELWSKLDRLKSPERLSELSWKELYWARHCLERQTHVKNRATRVDVLCDFCNQPSADICIATAIICSACVALYSAALLRSNGVHLEKLRIVHDPETWILDAVPAEWNRRIEEAWAAVTAAAQTQGRSTEIDGQRCTEVFLVDTDFPDGVLDLARKVAPLWGSVLLIGGTHIQQRTLAQMLHELSSSATGPLVRVDCRTAAALSRIGSAENGTLILEEVTALTTAEQYLLLDSLEFNACKWRLISTTADSAAFASFVEAGMFSESLYYRLQMIPLVLASGQLN